MNKRNKLVGYTNMFEGEKCQQCNKSPVEIVLSIPDKIKGLPIEKQYTLCMKCAESLGFKNDIEKCPQCKSYGYNTNCQYCNENRMLPKGDST